MVDALLEDVGVTRPPIPVERVAEALGARVRYAPFEGELSGMLICDDDGQFVVIGVNSLHHPNRRRFTIAHECGHLRLHHRQTRIDRSPLQVSLRDGTSSLAIDADEVEANRFAAELLMPYDMVKEDLADIELDIEDENALRALAERYRVSTQALTLRIRGMAKDALF